MIYLLINILFRFLKINIRKLTFFFFVIEGRIFLFDINCCFVLLTDESIKHDVSLFGLYLKLLGENCLIGLYLPRKISYDCVLW